MELKYTGVIGNPCKTEEKILAIKELRAYTGLTLKESAATVNEAIAVGGCQVPKFAHPVTEHSLPALRWALEGTSFCVVSEGAVSLQYKSALKVAISLACENDQFLQASALIDILHSDD